MNPFAVHQNPAQHCKSTTLQLKKKKKNVHQDFIYVAPSTIPGTGGHAIDIMDMAMPRP